MKLAVSEARVMTPHNSREKTGVYTSYSKMVAKLVFFVFLQISPWCIVLKVEIQKKYSLKRGNKGKYGNKQNNAKISAILKQGVLPADSSRRKATKEKSKQEFYYLILFCGELFVLVQNLFV